MSSRSEDTCAGLNSNLRTWSNWSVAEATRGLKPTLPAVGAGPWEIGWIGSQTGYQWVPLYIVANSLEFWIAAAMPSKYSCRQDGLSLRPRSWLA